MATLKTLLSVVGVIAATYLVSYAAARQAIRENIDFVEETVEEEVEEEKTVYAMADYKLAVEDFRYELAVNRDNALTQAELIPYIEGLIWAEERGLK